MSSKLIQMCAATFLGRRHLVNAYEMHAGWLIPFVDKRAQIEPQSRGSLLQMRVFTLFLIQTQKLNYWFEPTGT